MELACRIICIIVLLEGKVKGGLSEIKGRTIGKLGESVFNLSFSYNFYPQLWMIYIFPFIEALKSVIIVLQI